MFRGFAVGSLALIALYVAVQTSTANKASEASNAVVAGFRRLLDPAVAGLGNHTKAKAAATPPAAGSTPRTGQASLAIPGLKINSL